MPVLTRRRAGIHAPLAEPLRRVDGGHGQAPSGAAPAPERLAHGRLGQARAAVPRPGRPPREQRQPHHVPPGGGGDGGALWPVRQPATPHTTPAPPTPASARRCPAFPTRPGLAPAPP